MLTKDGEHWVNHRPDTWGQKTKTIKQLSNNYNYGENSKNQEFSKYSLTELLGVLQLSIFLIKTFQAEI